MQNPNSKLFCLCLDLGSSKISDSDAKCYFSKLSNIF